MKHLILVAILATFVGCMDSTVETKETKERYRGANIDVVTFDGCEYVKFGAGESAWGSHKGNCKNPIHEQNRKENKDLE